MIVRVRVSSEETPEQRTASGCFRMSNAGVIDLYDRVKVGTTVIVKQSNGVKG
ncbi:hypothetical protein PZN02_001598 [Sinorhizobium garamanticum]|uniref:L,D-TPase catalytic domain-containing protein n=1 Tax=Sinorhizobium garamanticum TaxID=680247 RepID=A0ABY8DDV9_9HYPH|nr:L,D-transpeptidase family protein [Sinorhizobium garamanticum]WEX89056.1 hypothetical protein PZN02_001598 [Sinorhizobium garamanticum]